jgi:hypothetical protein
MSKTYVIGSGIRVSVKFKETTTGDFVDPEGVVLKVKDPSLIVTTLTHGQDAELQKSAVGHYFAVIDCDQAGTWKYRWEGTGQNQAATEASFEISPSTF